MQEAPVVLVVNSSEDVIDAIRDALSDNKYITVTGHVPSFKRGERGVVDFFQEHKPDVVVWDIAPPYKENWEYFKTVRAIKEISKVPFVLTTTNLKHLKNIANSESSNAIEIVGKPYDLEKLVNYVGKALRSSVV